MKIAVAMSGGVDSSVAAALLQRQGHQVEGIFMKNWSPEAGQSLADCPWIEDQADAEAVCDHLQIPFRSINFEREYKEQVLDHFLVEYAAGRTPNPDVICNSRIKFGVFLEAVRQLGFEKMATGHYAQISHNGLLERAIDSSKDQSYFLHSLSQEQLAASLFPLGGMLKTQVRKLALEFGLPTARKKDSQGICFIGNLDLKEFLREYSQPIVGRVYLLDHPGEPISEKVNTAAYTLGERVGRLTDNRRYLKVTGRTDVPPLYVVQRQGNDLLVSPDPHCSGLYSNALILESWKGAGPPDYVEGLHVKVRYQQQEFVPLTGLRASPDGRIIIGVGEPYAQAAAIGQSAVVYTSDGEVLGGGVIQETNGIYGN